ncbi:MAG: nucleoside-diphosphate sugar epimerase/dehydratase [bacterium]
MIIGAGWAGRTIAQAIHDNLSADYEIAGFIDDDPHKQGQTHQWMPFHNACLLCLMIDKICS